MRKLQVIERKYGNGMPVRKFLPEGHTRQSPTQNDIYQMMY